jgi:hypothetical protein
LIPKVELMGGWPGFSTKCQFDIANVFNKLKFERELLMKNLI